MVWPRDGQRTIYSINVEQNLEPLRRLLKETFPNENIHIQSTKDSLSMTGNVSATSPIAPSLVTPFGKSIVNNLKIAPPPDKQIMLKVRFAELNRNAQMQFGLNLVSTGAGNTIGRITTGQFAAPTDNIGGGDGLLADRRLNVFAFRPDLNLAAVLQRCNLKAFCRYSLNRTLVTTTGKASFLVGGEFPCPFFKAVVMLAPSPSSFVSSASG